MKRLKWRIQTEEGSEYPTCYHGVSHDVFRADHRGCWVVWYPIPWNLVVRWYRRMILWLRKGGPGRWKARGCDVCKR